VTSVCLAALVVVLALCAARSVRVFRSVQMLHMSRQEITSRSEDAPFLRVALLIPCRNVGRGVIGTLEWFAAMPSPPNMELKCYIIATDTEPCCLSTAAVALEHIDAVGLQDRFVVITPPKGCSRKASKINYAIRCILSSVWQPDYFGVYDCDSRPEHATLRLLAGLCCGGRPEVIQQPSLFRPPERPVYSSADAWSQSIWTLSHELPRWWKNTNKRSVLHYLVGHGLFIARELAARQPLPEEADVEDLLYGYSLWGEGIVPVVLPAFDTSDVPTGFIAVTRQKAKWFSASLYAYFAVQGAVGKTDRLAVLQRVLVDVWWCIGYLLFALLVVSVGREYWLLTLVIGLGCYVLHFCVPVIVLSQVARQVGTPEFTRASRCPAVLCLLGVLHYLFYNLGPLYGLWRVARTRSLLRAMNSFGQTDMRTSERQRPT